MAEDRALPRRSAPLRLAGGLALALALAGTGGCVRFGGKTPDRLISIQSSATVPAGQMVRAPSASALVVLTPTVQRAFSAARVAVRDADGAYSYVKDAIWVDAPARMFQAVLSETIAAKTGRLVLDPGQFVAEPSGRLTGELVDFAIESATREAIVTYDASLLAPDGSTISKQRFTASAPVGDINDRTAAPALGQAANAVAGQVAEWLKAQPGG